VSSNSIINGQNGSLGALPKVQQSDDFDPFKSDELDMSRPLRLDRSGTAQNAEIDVQVAGRRTLQSWARFTGRSEIRSSFATALDGKNAQTRSRDQSGKITQILSEIVAANETNPDVYNSGPFRGINFVLAGNTAVLRYQNQSGVQIPPETRMAVILDAKEPPKILLSGVLGLPEMVSEAENGIAMVIAETAKTIGIDVANGPAWSRLVSVKSGNIPMRSIAPKSQQDRGKPPLVIEFNGQSHTINADRYTRTDDVR